MKRLTTEEDDRAMNLVALRYSLNVARRVHEAKEEIRQKRYAELKIWGSIDAARRLSGGRIGS